MPKTWFQHDMNSTQKDGLSALISKGGFSAYGRFWAFMELFYTMQINRDEFKSTININENTLLKQLQMNRRSLPKLLELFQETLAIVFEKNCETFGIVYKTTAPNSLIYLRKRNRKATELEVEEKKDIKTKEKKKKYNPLSDCSFFTDTDFTEAWFSWKEVRNKKKCSNSDRAIKAAIKKLMQYSSGEKKKAIQILDNSANKGYSDLWELNNKTNKTKTYGIINDS